MREMPLGGKAYGHICHLPGSRLVSGDRRCESRQAAICTERMRDSHDRVIVTEKLDGTNVSVARIDGELVAINRAGNRCDRAPQENHRVFGYWAGLAEQRVRFDAVLREGERIVGEWLAQGHGTDYRLPHEPFVVFDLMRGETHAPWDEIRSRVDGVFAVAAVFHDAHAPYSVADAAAEIRSSRHGAVGGAEGAVWRVEREGRFDFLAKWVRPARESLGVDSDEQRWFWHPWKPISAGSTDPGSRLSL